MRKDDVTSFNVFILMVCFTVMNDNTNSITDIAEYEAMLRPLFFNIYVTQTPSVEYM